MTRTQKREVAIALRIYNEMAAGIRQAELALGGFRSRVNREFRRLATAISIALVGAFTASAVAGAEFEQSLANVASVARATEAEMAALEARALSLGETTAYTASQAADAMYSLASGGLNTAQIVAATEGVLKLAGATLSDMGQSAELTMSTMRQFGIEAENTERIVNTFAAGIQNSMLNMGRLADAMKYAGPVASGLNISLEETVATLAALHNAGLLGRQAGTGLRAVLTSLAAPTEDLRRAMRGLAVERDGLPAVIEQLRNAHLSVGELTAMFGQEALPAILALTREGAAGLNAMTDAVTDTRAAWEMYDKQMDTTTGRWKLIKSAVEGTLLRVFKEIKPTLNEAQDAILNWVNQSRAAIVDFVGKAVSGFKDLLRTVGEVIAYIRENQDTFIAAAKAIGVATAAVYAFSVAVGVVNAIMAASPIGLIVAAIAALTAGIVFLVEKMGGWKVAWLELRRIFALTVEHLRWGWNAMIQDFRNFTHTGEALKQTWQVLWTALKDGFESFRVRFSQSWEVMWRVIRDPRRIGELRELGDVWEGLGQELAAALGTGVSAEITAAWQEAADRSNAASQEVWEEYVSRANEIEHHYQQQIEAIRAAREASRQTGAQGLGEEDFQLPEPEPLNPEVYEPFFEEFKRDAEDAGDTGKREFRAIHDAARQAAFGIGNLLVDAIFDAKNAMEALGSIGRSVLGILFSGGISYLLGGIGPDGGFFNLAFGGAGAVGGPVSAGKAYWVGERGERELFVPQTNGRLIPESKLGGQKDTHVTINVSAPINVTPGSLLLADDSMAMKRLAKTVGDEISRNISRTYKE